MWRKVAVWFANHTWDNIIRQIKAWHKWTLANTASTAAWAFCIRIQIINGFLRDDISIVPNLASKERDSLTKKKVLWHFCKTTLHRQASGYTCVWGPTTVWQSCEVSYDFSNVICHCGLSALIALQSKYWNKLDVQPYQRLKLASFQTFNCN